MVNVIFDTYCGKCGRKVRMEAVFELLDKPITSCSINCQECKNYLGSIYMLKDIKRIVHHITHNNLIGTDYKFL